MTKPSHTPVGLREGTQSWSGESGRISREGPARGALVFRHRSKDTIGHGMLREGIRGQSCSPDRGEWRRSRGAGTAPASVVYPGRPESSRPSGAVDEPRAVGRGDRGTDRLYGSPGEPD